jgi:hypothetical protein
MVIAVLLLVVAMTLTVRLVSYMAYEERAAVRRERALFEASNLLERLACRPWDEIAAQEARETPLPPEAQRALPGAECRVEVSAVERPLAGKRLHVEIRWRNRAGGFDAPVRLTTWVHRPGSTQP